MAEWGGGVRWEAIQTEIKSGPGREWAAAWAWVRSVFRVRDGEMAAVTRALTGS